MLSYLPTLRLSLFMELLLFPHHKKLKILLLCLKMLNKAYSTTSNQFLEINSLDII
jgi:hypothetical protein